MFPIDAKLLQSHSKFAFQQPRFTTNCQQMKPNKKKNLLNRTNSLYFSPQGGWMGNVLEQVSASHLITVERRTPQLANLLPVQTATRLAALLPFWARLPRTHTVTKKKKQTHMLVYIQLQESSKCKWCFGNPMNLLHPIRESARAIITGHRGPLWCCN